MKFSKSILFFGCIIMFLHGIVYARKMEEELNDKAQKVATFLEKFDVTDEAKKEMITYFSRPEAGIPIFLKIKSQKSSWYEELKRIVKNLEKIVFSYTLTEWKIQLLAEWARLKKRYISYPSDIEIGYKKYEKATKLLEKLRGNTKLPENIIIPVFERQYSEIYPVWLNNMYTNLTSKNNLHYCIMLNANLDEKYFDDDVIAQELGHEIAHIERGFWRPYRNLLFAKIGLVAFFSLLLYTTFDNTKFKSSFEPWIYSLYGVPCADLFKCYFKRLEEKACDLRAIEICKSGKGLRKLYLLEPMVESKYFGNDWEILEMKFRKRKKPLEYSWWHLLFYEHTHPSNAARIRYCTEYAKKLGYECD